MNFVRKMGARPGLAIDPLIPFNVQKMDFLPNTAFHHQKMMTLRGGVLQETTPSSMAASQFKYNTLQLCWREFSVAQWLWYWLFNQAALIQTLSRSYISAVHLFISYFVRKTIISNYFNCLHLNSTPITCYFRIIVLESCPKWMTSSMPESKESTCPLVLTRKTLVKASGSFFFV